MATKSADVISGYTYQWKIENISRCWLKHGEQLESPPFTVDAWEGTKWSLLLYPRGKGNLNYVKCYLHRKKDCSGPANFTLHYQLAFIGKNGSVLKEGQKLCRDFSEADSCGSPASEKRERIFFTERDAFLPGDALTVQCTMGKTGDIKPIDTKHLYARTVFEVNKRSYVWRIENFSTLHSGLKNSFEDGSIQFNLVLSEGLDLEKKIVLNINPCHESIKYFSFQTSVVDSEGKKENFGTHEYFADDLKKGASTIVLFLEKLVKNKKQYFPSDVLLLDCEYVYPNGDTPYELCSFNLGEFMPMNEAAESRNENSTEKKESIPMNDLKSMFDDAIFSDTEVCTSTRTFPTHKCILSARSPVFLSMFSNDMIEKNSGQVLITDFEDDTVHQMLLYLYTDSLENLDAQNASKLYMIAEKYQILALKERCSSFMMENLCPKNACEVLVLADLHNDKVLKTAAQDYILGQKKLILCSQGWKDFICTHTKLAADVMYQKIYND